MNLKCRAFYLNNWYSLKNYNPNNKFRGENHTKL